MRFVKKVYTVCTDKNVDFHQFSVIVHLQYRLSRKLLTWLLHIATNNILIGLKKVYALLRHIKRIQLRKPCASDTSSISKRYDSAYNTKHINIQVTIVY